MRVLLTGGAGFVGRAVLERLVARGFEVHALSRQARPSSAGIRWHAGDLLDGNTGEVLMRQLRPQALVHLAWYAEHGEYWDSPLNTKWAQATLALLQNFLECGGETAVAAGTSAEYDWSSGVPFRENDDAAWLQSAYVSSKREVWLGAQALFQTASASLAWARLFVPFGPFEDRRRLVPKVCLRLLSGESLAFDSGTAVRDFLHVEEVAAALVHLLDCRFSGAVNVASGEPRSVRSVVEAIARYLSCSDRVSFAREEQESASKPVIACVDRLRYDIGWFPEHTFKSRIAQTCEWWRQNQPAENSQ
jgi:nucleoside-diphosphate-sugar epimerase